MATEWFKAPDHVLDIVRRLIALYHEPLQDARVGVIMRSEAPVTAGRYTLGAAEKVSTKAQVHVPYDFVIWLANDRFQMLAPLQREALIDHELMHCQWDMDKGASIRPHDVEEFTEVLERYGYWWPQAEQFAAVAQQAELFERSPGDSGQGAVIAIPIENAAHVLRAAVEMVR